MTHIIGRQHTAAQLLSTFSKIVAGSSRRKVIFCHKVEFCFLHFVFVMSSEAILVSSAVQVVEKYAIMRRKRKLAKF
jgi:hypothetical protein